MICFSHLSLLSYLFCCQILVWSRQVWGEERLQGFNCAEESVCAQQSCRIPPVCLPPLQCLHLLLLVYLFQVCACVYLALCSSACYLPFVGNT